MYKTVVYLAMRTRITPNNICYTGDPALAGLTGKDGKKEILDLPGTKRINRLHYHVYTHHCLVIISYRRHWIKWSNRKAGAEDVKEIVSKQLS